MNTCNRTSRRRRILRGTATLALAASLLPGLAWSEAGGGNGRPRGAAPHAPIDGFIERHAERLELDDATVKKIREVVNRSRADDKALSRKIEAEQKKMRSLLEADPPDEDAVMEQADVVGALHAQERKNRLRAMMAIRAMLTPEQRSELQKIRREMHDAHGGKPPHRHGSRAP